MRILYIHQYFRKPAQGGALRSYYLAKALVDAGHAVEMITAYNGKRYRKETVDGIRVHYLPIPYDNQFSPARRLLAFLQFTFRSIWLALWMRKIACCYATSTPLSVGLTAVVLKKLKGIPFYFEVRDLWPAAPVQLGYIRRKIFQRLLYGLEHYLYRQAEKVVALSPGILQGIKPYKPAWALALIPNMADCDFYTPTSPGRSHYHDPFYICYTGALGRANRLDFLLAAAQACQQQGLTQVKFIIAGAGAEGHYLRNQAEKLLLKNITWAGTLPREQVKAYLAAAHATYTSFDVQPVLQTNSPNKFFDSLAAGKLTIVNTKGWLQELVEQHKCGFYADPLQPESFVARLQPYLEHPDLLQHAQQHARQLAEAQFSRQKLTQEFLELFRSSYQQH